MFTLTFDTLNAAFDGDDDGATETARILRAVADSIDAGNRTGSARDPNGNRVGSFDLDAEDKHRGALLAIVARVTGEFDQPDLAAFGPLGTIPEDCAAIAAAALADA